MSIFSLTFPAAPRGPTTLAPSPAWDQHRGPGSSVARARCISIRAAINCLAASRERRSCDEIDIPPEKAGKWRVEEEFANAIRGVEKITHTNFEDGVKYMEFTEAVHRSAESGRAVSLPLIEFNA